MEVEEKVSVVRSYYDISTLKNIRLSQYVYVLDDIFVRTAYHLLRTAFLPPAYVVCEKVMF